MGKLTNESDVSDATANFVIATMSEYDAPEVRAQKLRAAGVVNMNKSAMLWIHWERAAKTPYLRAEIEAMRKFEERQRGKVRKSDELLARTA